MRRCHTTLAILLTVNLIVGCGAGTDSDPADAVALNPAGHQNKPPVNQAAVPASSEKPPIEDPVEPEVFDPPYPHRADMFAKPRISQLPESTQRLDESGVVLKGFINVNGVRALLEINGVVKTLGEGQAHDGLTVVKINQPTVTLQRGRVQWEEKLFGS